MRSHYYDEIVGETIIYNGKPAIFEGHPATIIDFVSCYEGDFWRIKIEGVYPPDQSVPYYTPPGEIIKKEVARIRKEREENK